tara:strand:+ start:3438 stop:3797 length:360 start_codon:yes stop_codon:yes gene_type:complete
MSGKEQALRPPLTGAEKLEAFKRATSALPKWYADELSAPVTDDRLRAMLEAVLGIFGGSGGAGSLSICYQASGLKIWASQNAINWRSEKPIFAGKATISAARLVYKIAEPGDYQIDLFE